MSFWSGFGSATNRTETRRDGQEMVKCSFCGHVPGYRDSLSLVMNENSTGTYKPKEAKDIAWFVGQPYLQKYAACHGSCAAKLARRLNGEEKPDRGADSEDSLDDDRTKFTKQLRRRHQNQFNEERRYKEQIAKYADVTEGWAGGYRQKDPKEEVPEKLRRVFVSIKPKVAMVGIRALNGAALIELLRHYGHDDSKSALSVALWAKMLIWVPRFSRMAKETDPEGEKIPQRLRSRFDPEIAIREGRLSQGFNDYYRLNGGGAPTNLGVEDFKSLIRLGEVDVVVALFESQKLDPSVESLRAILPWTVDQERTSLVKYLLEKGANPNRRSADRQTALRFAVSRKNLDIVNLLLSHGAKPRIRSRMEYSYSDFNCPAAIKRLLEVGANPSQRDTKGYTPLYYEICGNPAYHETQVGSVKAFIDAGADLDAQFDPSTPGEFGSSSDDEAVKKKEKKLQAKLRRQQRQVGRR